MTTSAKNLIILVLAVGIGFLMGMEFLGKTLTDKPNESFFLSIHTSYLKGCMRMAQISGTNDGLPPGAGGTWDLCVHQAQEHTRETRGIIEQPTKEEPQAEIPLTGTFYTI